MPNPILGMCWASIQALPVDDVRTAWRQLVRDSHPDRMIARGVPEEAIRMSEKKLIAINRAWEAISEGRA